MSLPINIELMNIDKFIGDKQCKPVTTMFIKDPSSDEFHKSGLFSEEIFGQIGSTDRLVTFGYIRLNTHIFHPVIYGHLVRLKALYGEIIAGKSFAKFDYSLNDFITCGEDEQGSGTGYKFFIDNFQKIKFKKNNSITQNDKIDVINKYRDSCIIENCLVMPAGLRDMNIEDGKPASDSINKLYASLLNYAQAMPYTGSDDDIFDGVRFAIQKKVNEIYTFIFDMIEGKYGFFQRKYGSRNLALGTRNVISPADMSGSNPADPKFMKCDEVKLPLFEAAKMYQPLVIYQLKQLFLNEVFHQFADSVSLIDPKTYDLTYQPLSEDEKNKFLTTEGLEKILSLFRDKEFRFNYITVKNEKEESFYLYMVYDEGTDIWYTRSVSELINHFREHHKPFDPKKLRPMTYVEMIYVAVATASIGKCATVTRYPAMEFGSDVPCKAHVISTNPARSVWLRSTDPGAAHEVLFPEYPIINASFIDSTALHPSILKGLNADFDGDTVSVNGVLTKEANEEIYKHLNSVERFVHTNGSLFAKHTDLVALTVFNLSREPVQ